jgi:hypothetical protein
MSRVGLGRHARLGDEAGDPLDGLVNLFDVGMILAVAFLIAGLGLTLDVKGDKLTARHGAAAPTVRRAAAKRPATALDAGAEREIQNPSSAPRAAGRGTPVGQVYRLPDGRLVYVRGAGRAPRR